MFQLTVTGKDFAELKIEAERLVALLGGASPKTESVLSASEQARLRTDATVVPPKDKVVDKKAEKAAAKKAAEEAAAAKAAAEESTDEGEASDDDVLGEADETEALTHDDVKKMLIEVRSAYPKEATIVSQIVKDFGKAAKVSEVDAKLLPAVAKRCKDLMAKAKK